MQRSPAAHGGPQTGAGEVVTLWESPGFSRLLAPSGTRPALSRFAGRTADPMEDTHQSSVFLKDCAPREGPSLEQCRKICSCGKDSHWRRLWRTVSHGRDPTLEQGQSVRSPPPPGVGRRVRDM